MTQLPGRENQPNSRTTNCADCSSTLCGQVACSSPTRRRTSTAEFIYRSPKSSPSANSPKKARCPSRTFAERLGLEKSTVSRLAAGMEARGWLSRQREATNRRFYQLHLTDEGREVALRVAQDLRDHHAHLLDLLTTQERRALTTGLTGLIRAMESHAHLRGQAPVANDR